LIFFDFLKKKIKSFEALQTQPSPLPSEKAEATRNASTKKNKNKKTIKKILFRIFYFRIIVETL